MVQILSVIYSSKNTIFCIFPNVSFCLIPKFAYCSQIINCSRQLQLQTSGGFCVIEFEKLSCLIQLSQIFSLFVFQIRIENTLRKKFNFRIELQGNPTVLHFTEISHKKKRETGSLIENSKEFTLMLRNFITIIWSLYFYYLFCCILFLYNII